MLRRLFAVSFFSFVILAPVLGGGLGGTANAADNPPAISGVFLTTKYPTMTARAGETATVDLSVHNYHLPPQILALSVPQTASGWKATILGGGQPVGAIEVGPDSEERLQLRLEPPQGVGHGDYAFTVEAKSAQTDEKLPVTVLIGEEVPAKLKLTTNFPNLRGTPTTSFKYRVTINNDSGRDATVNLSADAPKNFQVGFTEAYGSQQLTSIPIEAGKSKDVEASLTIPRETTAGDYKLTLHAKTDAAGADLPVSLTLVGQPRLAVSGEGGRLSGDAYAGKDSELTIVLRNDGTEAARDIELSATTPEGWKSSFDPKQVQQLPAGGTQNVKVTLTPSDKAIAGDYQATIRASGAGGLSESANFRITVLTSTLWGSIGIAIIAIALLVVVFSVARFGRR
ncbi:MAG: ABC transporter substrate-binding protein [Alphaproteobacteria bacterium]|nr:ABC transporter substrate-binding protein [Alphaproteobacteria bacterium]